MSQLLSQSKKIELGKLIHLCEENRSRGDYLSALRYQQQALHLMLTSRPSRRLCYWITINFDPQVTLDQIKRVLEAYTSRTVIDRYWYCIEQRGESDAKMGTGMHSHILCLTKPGDRHIRYYTKRQFRQYVGYDEHIDIRTYPISMLEDKIDYIKGMKWDRSKDKKIFYDSQFRLKNNIDTWYTNESDSGDVVTEAQVGETERTGPGSEEESKEIGEGDYLI